MGLTRKPSGAYLWGPGPGFESKLGHMSSQPLRPGGLPSSSGPTVPSPEPRGLSRAPDPLRPITGACLSHVSSCEAQLTCLFTHLQSVIQLMRNLRLREGRDSPKVTQLKNHSAELETQILGKAGGYPVAQCLEENTLKLLYCKIKANRKWLLFPKPLQCFHSG